MRKVLFALLLSLLYAAPSFATIVAIDSQCGNGGTKNDASVSLASATQISVITSYIKISAAPTISDTQGRTYNARAEGLSSGTLALKIFDFYGAGLSGTTTINANCAGQCSVQAICAITFGSTLTVAAFDAQNSNNLHSAATTLTTGSVTPAECNEVVVTGLSDTGSVTETMTGYTVITYPGSGGNNFPTAAGYKVLTAASAENPTWNFGAGTDAAASIATYKSTSGTCAGGGHVSAFSLLGVQ